MAGIPGDNAQTRLTESKAGVPGVSNANRTRGKETRKNILERKEFPKRGSADGLLPKILAPNHTKTKTKTIESSSFFARGAGHAPARATRPRSRSRGDWTRLSAPRPVRRSAPSASEVEHAFRDVTKAHDRETLKHRLAMVHQYPNQEVVDGTAALAGVPGISVTDAKRSVEPRTHLAKVAFDIQDSAVDAHQGTRVTTVNARGFAVKLFSSAAEKPAGRGCEVDAQRRWRGRSTSRPLNDRTLLEPPRACDIVRDRCASLRSRCSRGSSPGARAGSTFFHERMVHPRNLTPASVRLLTSPPLSSRRPRRRRSGETRGLRGGLTCGTSPSRARTSPPLPPQAVASAPCLVCRTETTLRPRRDSVCQGGMCLSFARQNVRTFDHRKPVAKSRSAAPFERGSRSINFSLSVSNTRNTRLTFTSLFSLFSTSRRLADETGAPPPAGPTHPREQRRREPRGRRLRHRPQLRRAGRGTGREVDARRGVFASRLRPGFAGAAVGAERRDWPPVAPPEGAQRRVRQAVREGAGGSGDGDRLPAAGARAASAAAGGGARTRGRRDASGAPARHRRHGGGAPGGQPGRGHGGRGYAAHAAHDDRRGRLRVG